MPQANMKAGRQLARRGEPTAAWGQSPRHPRTDGPIPRCAGTSHCPVPPKAPYAQPLHPHSPTHTLSLAGCLQATTGVMGGVPGARGRWPPPPGLAPACALLLLALLVSPGWWSECPSSAALIATPWLAGFWDEGDSSRGCHSPHLTLALTPGWAGARACLPACRRGRWPSAHRCCRVPQEVRAVYCWAPPGRHPTPPHATTSHYRQAQAKPHQ